MPPERPLGSTVSDLAEAVIVPTDRAEPKGPPVPKATNDKRAKRVPE
jgi:hypothetical protein